MELTKEEYDNLILQKDNIKNIFDILVLLYSYIDGKNKKKYRAKYVKFIKNNPDYWKKLELLNNEFLDEMIPFSVFLDRFWELISQKNVRNYAFKMLFSYSHYLTEGYKILKPEIQVNLYQKMFLAGPMNTVQDKYLLYIMPSEHFYKDFNSIQPEKTRVRFLDQNEFDCIDERIRSYKIVDVNRLKEKVKVIEYSQSNYVWLQTLKIAVVPVSPCAWFKKVPILNEEETNIYLNENTEIKKVVDIDINDDEEKVSSINESYKHILEKCIEESVQIVVFPEFARNNETLESIKDFLSKSMGKAENSLELIFLGSFSHNGSNKGILLNGSGTELLEVTKKYAYKKVKKEVLYREHLIDYDGEITLIDVPGLGRIEYSICKDGLDAASQATLWSVLEISFSIISAYSESLSYFVNLGSTFSIQYGGIQILANACATRMDGHEVEDNLELGNVIIPCAGGSNMRADKEVKEYRTLDYCWNECRKSEKIGSCIRIISIYRDGVSEGKALSMTLDSIIL